MVESFRSTSVPISINMDATPTVLKGYLHGIQTTANGRLERASRWVELHGRMRTLWCGQSQCPAGSDRKNRGVGVFTLYGKTQSWSKRRGTWTATSPQPSGKQPF